MALAPGDTFDRYRIDATLGEGGMGRVYRAYDTKLHRNVALKVVRLDEPDDAAPDANGDAQRDAQRDANSDAKARMLREARHAASLDHPNAVSVYDVDEVDGTLYLAMEFISGKTLRTLIAEGSAPWEIKVRWLVDAAKALAAAHRHGLIHRDVKPENVMVRADGVVKVLDFGIAKRVQIALPEVQLEGAAAFDTLQTAGNLVVGTPRYMAPEQIQGHVLDARVDQFAWGVVAYELFTGALPWGTKDGVQLLLAIIEDRPPPMTAAAPQLPAVVMATVARAMEKEPAHRFASMAEIISALEPYVSTSLRNVSTHVAASATTKTDMAAFRPPTKGPSSSSRRGWALAAAGAAVIVAGGLALALSATPSAPPLASVASASPSAAPTVVTGHPPPRSASPDALVAYSVGLQSFRDASFEAARQGFERAIKLDPSLGEAHFRLAILDAIVSTDELDARLAFRKALQSRGSLPAREQALLDAFDPYFQRNPPDLVEAEARLARAAAAYPLDAEVAFYLGYLRYTRGALATARAAFERSVELDPKFGQAWAQLAGTQAFLGDVETAKKTIDHCLQVCPSATDCLWYRTQIHEQSGECRAFEADVRQWIARDPEDYYGYNMLAKALRAVGKPQETVVAALEQKWAHAAPDRRVRLELLDRVRLALYAGEFNVAEKLARELDVAVASNPSAEAHADPTFFLFDLYDETGRKEKVRQVATAFLDRKDIWVPPVRVDDLAISLDPIPALLAGLARVGAITPAELTHKREDWIARWKARTTEAYTNHLWIYGFAAPARTREDAESAMEALPRFLPLPPFTPQSIADGHIGKAFLLAGRLDEALAHLEKAVRTCTMHDEPMDHVRAHLHVGQARAALGKKDEACAAFAVVLERWGNATPPSRTATVARDEAAKLGCAR